MSTAILLKEPRRRRNTGVRSIAASTAAAEGAIQELRSLLPDIDTHFVRVGELLSTVRKNHPGAAFADACALIGMKTRKAYYLAEIHERLAAMGVDHDIVASVGWTKLQVLLPVLTPTSFQEWVVVAKTVSVIRLKKLVAKNCPYESDDVTACTFFLTREQRKTLDAALVLRGMKKNGRHFSGKTEALMKLLSSAA